MAFPVERCDARVVRFPWRFFAAYAGSLWVLQEAWSSRRSYGGSTDHCAIISLIPIRLSDFIPLIVVCCCDRLVMRSSGRKTGAEGET